VICAVLAFWRAFGLCDASVDFLWAMLDCPVDIDARACFFGFVFVCSVGLLGVCLSIGLVGVCMGLDCMVVLFLCLLGSFFDFFVILICIFLFYIYLFLN
jgi:hypothetical protein